MQGLHSGSLPGSGREQFLARRRFGDGAKLGYSSASAAPAQAGAATTNLGAAMSNLVAFVILALAALLEAGGDAVVRGGIHASSLAQRVAMVVLGGLILTAYGVVVNTPSWDFGRLLGVYVTLFFLAAQAINATVFKVPPSAPILAGGALIVAGGLLMTFWRTA